MSDFTKRFPVKTLRQAYEDSLKREHWVFPDTICASVTTIYGRSGVGKSFLVSEMLLSLLVEDRTFLGMQPVDRNKLWKPVILWTDPDSDGEYGSRIYPELADEGDDPIRFIHTGRVRPDEWEALADHVLGLGHNFVVLDNLNGVVGDSNDQSMVTAMFDGLTRLTNNNVPVVVLHHETEKGRVVPGAPPMGASVIVQKSRAWIHVRQTKSRRRRGGNTALIVKANALEQPQQIVAEPLAGPNYRIVDRGPWEQEQADAKARERNSDTLDRNAEMARYLVGNCQGKGLNAAAKELAAKFSLSEAAVRDSLMRGALSKLVQREGSGADTSWHLEP